MTNFALLRPSMPLARSPDDARRIAELAADRAAEISLVDPRFDALREIAGDPSGEIFWVPSDSAVGWALLEHDGFVPPPPPPRDPASERSRGSFAFAIDRALVDRIAAELRGRGLPASDA